MQNRTRNIQLIVRCSPKEKALIQKKMAAFGTRNFNRYALKMLLDGYVLHLDLTEFQNLANEVNKIGVNINQIAKVVNANGAIFCDDMNELKEMVNEIWRLLMSCTGVYS